MIIFETVAVIAGLVCLACWFGTLAVSVFEVIK